MEKLSEFWQSRLEWLQLGPVGIFAFLVFFLFVAFTLIYVILGIIGYVKIKLRASRRGSTREHGK